MGRFTEFNHLPPVITAQPRSQTVSWGEGVIFKVRASSVAPLSYQWRFNGTNISGATNASLTLASVQPANAGSYSVQVANVAGSVVSSNATLTCLDSPPALPEDLGERLDWWRFNDTNWLSRAGHAPTAVSNVLCVPSWSSNALQLDSVSAALLQYRVVETSGATNLTCDYGSLEFWFAPDWSSASLGGTGAGVWGRLLEVGEWSSDASNGWWSVYLNPDGTRLYFSAQADGAQSDYVSVDIAWASNEWHQIVLAYSPTNSALYLDGEPYADGLGVTRVPGAAVRAGGFRIGSDGTGLIQARGQFENLKTFNYPLRDWEVAGDFADTWPSVEQWQSEQGGQFMMMKGGQYAPENGPPSYDHPPDSLWLKITGVTNDIAYLLVHSPQSNGVYDLYFAPNLTYQRWQWRRVYCGIECDSAGQAAVTLQQPDSTQGYFVLLDATDTDGDGLANGYEAWFNYSRRYTSATNSDSDGDGMSDGWEVQYGLDPTDNTGTNGAEADPDGDGFPNNSEYFYYDYSTTINGSFDPLRFFNNSSPPTNRPVVAISVDRRYPDCQQPTFTLSRYGGDAADYSQPLTVYYSVGGTLRYGTDYTLDPAPTNAPGDPDYPDGYPRIFLIKIPANQQSVTLKVTPIGEPVASGEKTVVVALTPYSVAPKTQVSDPLAWNYVVDLHWRQDRATNRFPFVAAPLLTTECLPHSIMLKWTVPKWLENQDEIDFFYDFRIYRCETVSGICTPTNLYATVTNTARMYVDTGVETNQTYCYRVTFRHQDSCDASVEPYESPYSNTECDATCCPDSGRGFWTEYGGAAQQLAEWIMGPGYTVSSVTYTGAAVARGTFGNGGAANLPINTGVILSSGDIALAKGTNDQSNATKDNDPAEGDLDLESLVPGLETRDAAVLEFDVVSAVETNLVFEFIFASEEYPEWIHQFNDVVAIFVDGVNIAHVPGTNLPVSVNTINGGWYRFGDGDVPATNPTNYVDNCDPEHSSLPEYAAPSPVYNIQYDGTTVVLTAQTNISTNVTYHIKIAIADATDRWYDSAVFLKAQIPCP